MATVPYTFAGQTGPIPLSELDTNFANVKAQSTTAITVTASSQPNISSVGILNTVSTTGNVRGANIFTAGGVSAVGNVTGTYIKGDGSLLTGLPEQYTNSNVAAFLPNYSGNLASLTGLVSVTGNVNATDMSITSNAVVYGNLTVYGTTVSYSSANLTTNNLTITVGNNQSTGTALNGAGLLVGTSNIARWQFNNPTTSWQTNLGITPGSNANVSLGGTTSYWQNLYVVNVTAAGNLSVGGTTALTGVATAPTAANGVSNTQIATTAFVGNAVTIGLNSLGTISTQNANAIAITGGNISGLTNPLPVSSGGIGAATLTVNSVLLGNGTNAPQTVAPGTGGNVLTSNGTTWQSSAIGVIGLGFGGTTWNNVTGSRSFNATYTNTRGYPIAVSATATCAVTSEIHGYVNGILVAWYQWQFNGCGSYGGTFIIVPPGATYSLNSGQGVYNWVELY